MPSSPPLPSTTVSSSDAASTRPTSAVRSSPSTVVFAQPGSLSVREATYLGIAFLAATAGSFTSAYGRTIVLGEGEIPVGAA
ncbi:hypothetical protein ACFVAM_33165, partial [Streptomyces californicus]|uniref:hypothetical protein n=1 Tax=Streptomyces californicus TaxID=67351 RepID=UPI0036D042F9